LGFGGDEVVDAQGRNYARLPRAMFLLALLTSSVLGLSAMSASAHGELAGDEGHDDPTTGELLLTPILVGIIHIVAMVALLVLAYKARATGSVPDTARGPVPEEARAVFGQFLKQENELAHAFRPNRRMYIISTNLPHFFILTALATFFSIYTYKWLGDNTVLVYTSVHATAIVILFAHSTMGWKNTWYGVSPRSLYASFGTFGPLAITMPLRDLDRIEVRQSRLKGLLDVSSLRLVFVTGEHNARVDLTMRAIDNPDKIKEVILDEASKSKIDPD